MALHPKTAEKEKDETPQDEPEGQNTAQEVIAETETNKISFCFISINI